MNIQTKEIHEKSILTEIDIQKLEKKLEDTWIKIQDLKKHDEFAAQIMYEKYKALASELPPPYPT